jgi:hypothetical protein
LGEEFDFVFVFDLSSNRLWLWFCDFRIWLCSVLAEFGLNFRVDFQLKNEGSRGIPEMILKIEMFDLLGVLV